VCFCVSSAYAQVCPRSGVLCVCLFVDAQDTHQLDRHTDRTHFVETILLKPFCCVFACVCMYMGLHAYSCVYVRVFLCVFVCVCLSAFVCM